MTLKIIVDCEHSGRREVELPLEDKPYAERLAIRDVILACPGCHFEADRWLKDVGA